LSAAAGNAPRGAASPPPEAQDAVAVGAVGRPHGLGGAFHVTRPLVRALSPGAVVSVAGERRVIVRRAGTDSQPILALEGVEDRDAAGRLRGERLTVARGDLPALEAGEWWAHELEGCAVFAGERRLGTVTRLIELPSCEALEVAGDGGAGPLLVPMVKDAVRDVQTERRRIEVNAGFLAEALDPAGAGGQGGRGD
jgi:16S rRNA processing protein RimM